MSNNWKTYFDFSNKRLVGKAHCVTRSVIRISTSPKAIFYGNGGSLQKAPLAAAATVNKTRS